MNDVKSRLFIYPPLCSVLEQQIIKLDILLNQFLFPYLLDTFSANMEISKRRSWESSRSVLSSQPEEVEPDEKTEDNDFSKYASVWQSNSGLNQSEPRAGESAVAAPKGQGKPKEGSRLVRKLKHFRKGIPVVFVHIVYTETI